MSKWEDKNLSSLALYHNGYAFKPSDWAKSGVKIIRIEQLNNPFGVYDYFQGRIPEINAIKNGDLIFSWSATLKVVIWKYGNGVLNQHLFRVDPFSNVDKYFLFYLIDFNIERMAVASQGSTMRHIRRGELDRCIVKVPVYKNVQSKIGRILVSVDKAIEKTQKAIDKLKNIKQGMMHDLFTRGIDVKTGKLRPSYSEAPELYKETELGWIPKEWEISEIKNSKVEIIDGDRGENYPKQDDFREQGFCLFLNAGNVTSRGFNFTNNLFITEQKDSLLGTGKLVRGDIIITSRGTVGNMAYYDDGIAYGHIRINSGMFILRNYDKDLLSEYLFYALRERLFAKGYSKLVSGSAQPQLPIKDFNIFYIIKPNMPEQAKILSIAKSYDDRVHNEEIVLSKYMAVKQGLMQDLLTGKVEVIPDPQDEEYQEVS